MAKEILSEEHHTANAINRPVAFVIGIYFVAEVLSFLFSVRISSLLRARL